MWIIAVVAGLVLLVVLLLAVPFDVAFQVSRDGTFSSRLRVGWMFNLVGKDLGGRKKPRGERPDKERKRPRVKPFLAMFRARGFPRRLLRYVRDVLRTVHVRELEADLRVGLSDPADTGMLFALIGPAAVYLRAITPLDIRVQSDFQQAVFQGHFKGDLRVFPIQLLAVTVVFACSPATLRGIKAMVVARRR